MENHNKLPAFTTKAILNLPRKWYSNHFVHQLYQLESFIDLSSEEIKDSKIKYLCEKQLIEPKDENTNPIEYYAGLDDQTFAIDDIFTEYFPDLKRKSNFILIISHLEDGLRELCHDLSSEFSVKFNAKSSKGIFQAISIFIKSSLKLKFDIDNDVHWKNLLLAYSIRNKIIHLTDKKFSDSAIEYFKISKEFVFSENTNELLLQEIHNFLKRLEIELVKI